jgi:hypothetical protein
MPLNRDDLELLRKWSSITLSNALGMPSRPTNAEMEARYQLEDRIDALIAADRAQSPSQTYFCKFSTRSPKDSGAGTKGKEETDSAEKRLQQMTDSLRIQSGQEATELLIKSQRIFCDISFHFQHGLEGTSSGSLALLLREWVDMRPDYEFRCYVYQGKMTAISQYHCYSQFDSLQDEKHVLAVRDSIVEFHSVVSDAFSLPSYVIDIAVDPRDMSCQVIELNPFGKAMSSGSGLFHWIHDEDLLYDRLGLRQTPIRVLRTLLNGSSSQ